MLSRRGILTAPLLGRTGESSAVSGTMAVLLSDLGWIGGPEDSAWPNRIFDPRVLEPLNIERALPIVPGGTARAAPTIGDVLLINADGALDHLLAAPVDGRSIAVYRGKPGADFAEFELLFRGTTSSWRDAGDARMTLGLRGAAWQLEVPVNRPVYQGTGGAEGGADIRGKFKPGLFGYGRNILPVLVDADLGVYQFHFRQALEVIGVYDGGVAYTPAGDVADIFATSVALGTVKTQLSQGLIRVGTPPARTLTVDAKGDAPSGVYAERAADIAFRILHDLQGFNDGLFDYATFETLNQAAAGPVNIYLGLEPITAAAVVDQIMTGILGWWSDNPQGRIEVGLTGLPAAQPRARLELDDLFELQMLPLPEAIETPFWRVTVGYGRNWTPLDATQIGDAVKTGDAARFAFLTQEYRFTAPIEDVTIRALRHLRARELVFLSAYDNLADAEALAQRLFDMYSTPRRLARLRTKRQGQKLRPGDTIALDYPRYGLTGGKNVTIVGQGAMGSSFDTTLTVLW
jgi:hypothetical protein